MLSRISSVTSSALRSVANNPKKSAAFGALAFGIALYTAGGKRLGNLMLNIIKSPITLAKGSASGVKWTYNKTKDVAKKVYNKMPSFKKGSAKPTKKQQEGAPSFPKTQKEDLLIQQGPAFSRTQQEERPTSSTNVLPEGHEDQYSSGGDQPGNGGN